MAKSSVLSSISQVKKDLIPSSSSKVIDSISLNNFFSIEYKVTIFNETENLARSFSLLVLKSGSNVNDSLFARTGNGDLSVSVIVNGSSAELQITNNEIFDVNVNYTTIIL
jgi:hypothetical protein